MEQSSQPRINRMETFEQLPKSPIVEAVLHIQCRLAQPIVPAELRVRLDCELSGYAFANELFECTNEFTFGKDGTQNAQTKTDWKGLRYQSEDQKQVVLFTKDGLVFSRLKPYQSWDGFVAQGLAAWNVFKRVVQPDLIMRIGLRMINRITVPVGSFEIEDYLVTAPQPPKGFDFPYQGFMHHEVMAVPETPFSVTVVKAILPAAKGEPGPAIVIDIDTFMTPNEMVEDGALVELLTDMRWIKNKVFFGTVTDKTLEAFK